MVELRYTCVSIIHAIQPGVHTSLYVWYAAAYAVLKLGQLYGVCVPFRLPGAPLAGTYESQLTPADGAAGACERARWVCKWQACCGWRAGVIEHVLVLLRVGRVARVADEQRRVELEAERAVDERLVHLVPRRVRRAREPAAGANSGAQPTRVGNASRVARLRTCRCRRRRRRRCWSGC